MYLLPIVVASVIILVQHSVALAFSLLGIVGAVRFRNDLKTPSDAAFVFATLAIGIAAGVSEIGVAGVTSMVFSLTAVGLRIFAVVEGPATHSKPGGRSQMEAAQPLSTRLSCLMVNPTERPRAPGTGAVMPTAPLR